MCMECAARIQESTLSRKLYGDTNACKVIPLNPRTIALPQIKFIRIKFELDNGWTFIVNVSINRSLYMPPSDIMKMIECFCFTHLNIKISRALENTQINQHNGKYEQKNCALRSHIRIQLI